MGYSLQIPIRRLESIFGIAYPSLRLDASQKCKFIRQVLVQKNKLSDDDSDYGLIHEFRVNLLDGKRLYEIEIGVEKRQGYDIALNIEKWFYSTKRLSILSPPRFWNRLFRGSRPVDSYLISDINMGNVLSFLEENAKITDYQIYSKFGSDFSLGFKNLELSTMFKLKFGDQDV